MSEQSRSLPLNARIDSFAGTAELVRLAALRKIQRMAVGLSNVTVEEVAQSEPIDIPENIILAEE